MSNDSKVNTEDLMLRVLRARVKINEAIKPSKHYATLYMVFNPEDNTPKGLELLRRVWHLRCLDEKVTEKLERLPELIKQS